MFLFHHFDHVLKDGDFGSVADEDFVADRQAFGRNIESDVDLFAIRTLIRRTESSEIASRRLP